MCNILSIITLEVFTLLFFPMKGIWADTAEDALSEIISLRTSNSRTFDNHDGTYTTKISPVSSFSRDGCECIETGIVEVNEVRDEFTKAIKTSVYIFRSDPEDITKGNIFERDGYFVKYVPAGDWTGRTVRITPNERGVKEEVVIANEKGLVVYWDIFTSAVPEFSDGGINFSDSTGTFLFRVPAPSAKDGKGMEVPVKSEFEKNRLTFTVEMPDWAEYPVVLDPTTTTVNAVLDGYVYTSQGTYINARDASSGAAETNDLRVGQNNISGTTYRVYRSFLSFSIPNMISVSACTLFVNGSYDFSNTDFNIFVFGAGSYKPLLDSGDFSRFDGRRTGTYHNGTVLNSSAWNSANYSADWNNTGPFAQAGLDSVFSAKGDTLRIALVSSRDTNNTAPSESEFAVFESSANETLKPYISITYVPLRDDPPSEFSMSSDCPDSINAGWSDNSDMESGFVLVNWPDNTPVAEADTIPQNATSVKVGGLAPNTTYNWRVKAFGTTADKYSSDSSAMTDARTPGITGVTTESTSSLRIYLNPLDNPLNTNFAVQDSVSGKFVDASSDPDTLRAAPLGEWGWTNFSGWGGVSGRVVGGLKPDSLYVFRAKARGE